MSQNNQGQTMKQAIMPKPGVIEYKQVQVPEMKRNQIMINIKKIGICGSDIHVYHGVSPYASYPVVQGHEVSGIVTKTGEDVVGFNIGDKVTIRPQIACGECYPCKHNDYHICENLKVMGFQVKGMASEYVVVDSDNVLRLPQDVSLDEGAMIEPVAVATRAVRRGGDVSGKNVLVLGAGTIGNLAAQIAKGLGANKVIITDLSEYRLKLAKSCGVDHCINTKTQDLSTVISDLFGSDKADLILECAGVNQTISQALENARKGTDIIVVGVFCKKVTVDLDLLENGELRLIGSLMYKQEDYAKAIELIEQKKIRLKPLITNNFEFNQYREAYEYIIEKRDEAMKVIVDV